MTAAVSLHFPPPDARPRGTGRSRRGRRVTADAVDRPFAHATGDDRDQVGTGRDPRGDSGATCKTAGFAYTGSNPVPATPPLTCGNGRCTALVTPPGRAWLPFTFPPPDALPTPLVAARSGRTRRGADVILSGFSTGTSGTTTTSDRSEVRRFARRGLSTTDQSWCWPGRRDRPAAGPSRRLDSRVLPAAAWPSEY
jgi:hypothetical protein